MTRMMPGCLAVAVGVIACCVGAQALAAQESVTTIDFTKPPTTEVCKADIMLTLDISKSSTKVVWEEKILLFLAELTTRLDIGQDKVRMGLVSFNDTAYQYPVNGGMLLANATDDAAVSDRVSQIVYHRGPTCLECGLKALRENFEEDLGDRPDVADYAIVVSDGVATIRQSYTKGEADANINRGITTFALAVQGENYPDTEILEDITGNPKNIFFMSSEAELLAAADAIAEAICPGGGPDICEVNPCDNGATCVRMTSSVFECICPLGVAGVFCESECNKADLAFIVDASSSIKGTRWREIVIPFVRDFVDHFTIGPNDTHVAAISFSDYSLTDFSFNSVAQTSDSIHSAIDDMVYIKKTTCISCGLREATDNIFQEIYGDRPDVPNVAIVFSDGKANVEEALTTTEADRLKSEANAQVFAIGVTGSINETELQQIVTQPHEDYYIRVNSFSDLLDMTQLISGMACKKSETKGISKRSMGAEARANFAPSRFGRGFTRRSAFTSALFGDKHE